MGVELGRIEGEETMVRMYCMREDSIVNKNFKKRRKNSLLRDNNKIQ